jgi:hypothetical protein
MDTVDGGLAALDAMHRRYPALICAEWKRLMEEYAVSVAEYRRGIEDAKQLIYPESAVMQQRLDELRNKCRDARSVLEDHRQRHGCSDN